MVKFDILHKYGVASLFDMCIENISRIWYDKVEKIYHNNTSKELIS